MPIRFFYEGVDFKISHPVKVKNWIKQSVDKERREVSQVNYIFCLDKFLLDLNKEYLNHNTLTDIITFDNSKGRLIDGEIYISIERVAENSLMYGTEITDELHRVMIHGILHLCGYRDKSASEKTLMRKKEDAYLSLHKRLFHVKRKSR
jgi:probable rRNA maturation factor